MSEQLIMLVTHPVHVSMYTSSLKSGSQSHGQLDSQIIQTYCGKIVHKYPLEGLVKTCIKNMIYLLYDHLN